MQLLKMPKGCGKGSPCGTDKYPRGMSPGRQNDFRCTDAFDLENIDLLIIENVGIWYALPILFLESI